MKFNKYKIINLIIVACVLLSIAGCFFPGHRGGGGFHR